MAPAPTQFRVKLKLPRVSPLRIGLMRGIIQLRNTESGSVSGGRSLRFEWLLYDSGRYSLKSARSGAASARPMRTPPARRSAAFHHWPERSPTKIRTSANRPVATIAMKAGSGMPTTSIPATERPSSATGSRRGERMIHSANASRSGRYI